MTFPPKALPFNNFLSRIHRLWWVGSKIKMCYDVQKRTGLNMERVRKRERRIQESQHGEKTERGRGKTGWKENSKRDVAFLTWGGGRGGGGWGGRGEEKRGRTGGRERGEEVDKRKFNLAPDSISIGRYTLNIDTMQVAQSFWWLPIIQN